MKNFKYPIKKILKNYNSLLKKSFDFYGLIPEFIDLNNKGNMYLPLSLCQTRGIFYFLHFGKLFDCSESISYSSNLYKLLKKKYFNPLTNRWFKYPDHSVEEDLYGCSFLLLSISHLYVYYHEESILDDITNLYKIIKILFISDNYSKLKNNQGFICQNSLMHLFESLIAAYQATKINKFKILAERLYNDIARLFFCKDKYLIFESSNFNNFPVCEPGHNFEWACLIFEAIKQGFILTPSINDCKLFKTSFELGVIETFLVKPEIESDRKKVQYRVWPILECLRYLILNKNNVLLEKICNSFLQYYTKNGMIIEYINYDKTHTYDKVKSTTGYHLINAFQHF